MPIYEYQCEACGHSLEALQQLSDPPLKKCPDCGKPRLRRLLSAPMFLLKGSGWYETDFKSDKEIKRNLADRPDKDESKADASTATSASKAETKTESPAPKAEAQSEGRSEGVSKRASVAVSKPRKGQGAARAGLKKAKRRRG